MVAENERKHAARLPTKGRALSWLGTLGFLGWFSLVFLGFSSIFPRISESDVLMRCSYDSSLTVPAHILMGVHSHGNNYFFVFS